MSPTPYIIAGLEARDDVPKESMGKYFLDVLKRRRSEEIINIDAVTGDTLTCGELLKNSVLLTAVFENFGVEKGDVITIVSENTINYVIPVLAAFYKGIVFNPLNADYTPGELKHALLISKPKLIFCSEKALDRVLQVEKELQFVKRVILTGSCSTENPKVNTISDLLNRAVLNVNYFKPETFDYRDQIAVISLSSGTTGLPKGVLLTHQNLRSSVCVMVHPSLGDATEEDTLLQSLPFFHIYGLTVYLGSVASSAKVVVMDKFKPDLCLQSIEKHKVTKLFTVPTIMDFLAKSPLVNDYNISSIRDIACGAAPLSKDILAELRKRVSAATLRQGYGLTETCGACMILNPNSSKTGSVGNLAPECLAKIVNPDTNKPLGPLEIGELCFQGVCVMKGYIGASVQDCFDEEGFYHSGDLGYYDEDNAFYITGRLKELIKYKGFQISPTELEELILKHPSVRDCGVIGIPDDRCGELPLAFVALCDNANVTEQDIINFVAERISIQKRLHGGVRFTSVIPRSAAGKVLRHELQRIFKTS